MKRPKFHLKVLTPIILFNGAKMTLGLRLLFSLPQRILCCKYQRLNYHIYCQILLFNHCCFLSDMFTNYSFPSLAMGSELSLLQH